MRNESTETSHKTILKATGIFGFTQVFKIMIGVIGSKFVAVFLGPAGIGILGLLNNTLAIIGSVTGLGLNISGVREVAMASTEEDPIRFSSRLIILKRWSVLVGITGFLVTLLFSPLLSRLTFGSSDYTIWFVMLAFNFIFSAVASSHAAILQGLRMLKLFAVSNVISSFLVAIVTVPIYYFFRMEGIVPALLLASSINLLVNWYFSRNLIPEKVSITLAETITKGKPLLKIGFLLSLNVIFGQLCVYCIKWYLNGSGSTSEILGLYEVSTVILVSYVGMIFNAMGTDFYPRLTALAKDNGKVRTLVNDQIEIALLLITPAILFFYFLSPLIIELLYTKDFLGVLLILRAALFAVIIKGVIWPLGFIILSKGNNMLYFAQEIISDLLNIVLTIGLYHYYGLIGIGIASVIHFAVYGFYIYYIVNRNYNFSFRTETLRIIGGTVLLGILAAAVVFYMDYPYAYFPLGGLFIIAALFSLRQLNRKIDLKNYLEKIRDKIRNRF